MNRPYYEISSSDAEGREAVAACGRCDGKWSSEQVWEIVFRDNLIYLPFAAHLAEKDAEESERAA